MVEFRAAMYCTESESRRSSRWRRSRQHTGEGGQRWRLVGALETVQENAGNERTLQRRRGRRGSPV